MQPLDQDGQSVCRFVAEAVPCTRSGLQGYTVRVMPSHQDVLLPQQCGLVTWAADGA
jgi:hypothetical protein